MSSEYIDENVQPGAEEIERSNRRKQRLREMRRKKKQQELMRRWMLPCTAVLIVLVILAGTGIRRLVRKPENMQNTKQSGAVTDSTSNQDNPDSNSFEQSSSEQGDLTQSDSDKDRSDKSISFDSTINVAGCYIDNTIADNFSDEIAQASTLIVRTLGGRSNSQPLHASADDATVLLGGELTSENSVFIDVEEERILGQRDAAARISPASMTKILTVLVAAEHTTNLDDTFKITQDIIDYSFVKGCSNAGFEVGEEVTVEDLFYGTALPSGADAALGLAVYVAGSHEAFVELMNEKLEELGLSETTHFTNCVGVYEENHYSTVYDIAVILKAACDNSFCREVLSRHMYKTSVTEQHPEGLDISNLFLRRIEDRDTHGEVLCAKTGYVVQSGNCAASLSIGNDGKEYICVTAHSNNPWWCIGDHVTLYQQFLPE